MESTIEGGLGQIHEIGHFKAWCQLTSEGAASADTKRLPSAACLLMLHDNASRKKDR